MKGETLFVHELKKAADKHHFFWCRIESGATRAGIPDVYVVTPRGIPVWFELKRDRSNGKDLIATTVTWRPGQQAFLYGVSKYGQAAYTLLRFDDCVWCIPHKGLYEEDRVYRKSVLIFPSVTELITYFS